MFSNACGDRSQVMIRLYGDVLDVECSGNAVKAHRLHSSRTAPPGAAVADFKAIVKGQVKGGAEAITLTLTHNAKGLLARIDGSDKAVAPLGPGVVGLTVRHCDLNRNALPGAPAPAMLPSPPQLLKDARFRTPYFAALGPRTREPWLRELNGPAPESQKVTVAGASYLMASVCKPHDCYDHNLVLLYDAAQGVVYGKLNQIGRSTLLGRPSPPVAAELERLWREQFRKK